MSVAEKTKPRLVKPPKAKPEKVEKHVADNAVMDFQTDAIALEERKPPIAARLTLYLVATAICTGVAWASVSKIDEIVVAPGKLSTSQPMLVVQPLETSIIRDISVRPGDIVEKGQLLATLDPTFSSSDEGQLKSRLANLGAQVARLRAEVEGRDYAPNATASAEELMQGQLFLQRRLAYDARLSDYDAQIAQSQAVIDASRSQQEALDLRLAGIREIETMRSDLAQTGNGSRLALLESRDLGLDLQVSVSQIAGQLAQAIEQLNKSAAERRNFIEDYRRLTLEQLVELEDRHAEAREEFRKVELLATMSKLYAPADGAVLEVAERSIASVVQPAEPLITLVPINVPLDVEVMVASDDIGHLALGDLARIKFDAFPFPVHGTMEGTVTTISGSSFSPTNGTEQAKGPAFYKVGIKLGEEKLTDLPEDFVLLPGMTVSAEIHAGERTVISYFLHPLIRGLDEALREP
ncbi:HlyD family type I secretion periplasmic adaptor subunit [Devosia sp. SD17-2]|uniref:HlyD family type I secretion periplasmic adaptor subunit n=1 Tax=Devosia sp. SD17-2 TaxID=2976459 RepID=UPI0023D8A220|nr:HlyD family type I secretion periplasmic adaptor subunit [Devosia sp. SD17-2]WEJ34202.1 HlyD family type I secretion periplasmic adaptor subunit [Devosia sp. SD17-2]